MGTSHLDNLVRIRQLKLEEPTQVELGGLMRSGNARLKDAQVQTLSLDSRFDLATKRLGVRGSSGRRSEFGSSPDTSRTGGRISCYGAGPAPDNQECGSEVERTPAKSDLDDLMVGPPVLEGAQLSPRLGTRCRVHLHPG
jgi:hypothetical protein